MTKREAHRPRSNNDLGDVTLGLDYQPFKSGGDMAHDDVHAVGHPPHGPEPLQDQPRYRPADGWRTVRRFSRREHEQIHRPGHGLRRDQLLFTVSSADDLSQYMDGVGQLDSVKPGMSFNAAIGLAYAISYALSMNVQFQYGYNMSTEYDVHERCEVLARRPTAHRPSSSGRAGAFRRKRRCRYPWVSD